MHWAPLDKTTTTIYKGLAILLIVMHNFLHGFPHPRQNEFYFRRERFDNLLDLLVSEPESIVRILSSYFGHYGVQIFIFLSAYGLTKKYLNSRLVYRQYLWDRITKIYPSFLIAVICWVGLGILWNLGKGSTDFDFITQDFDSLILKLLLISNFFPEHALKPVGPWWFLPFIFQFYVIFPVILLLVQRFGNKVLLGISIAGLVFTMIFHSQSFNLYCTLIPHLPEFCLAIYIAKSDSQDLSINKWVIGLLLGLFLLANLFQTIWYLSHLTALILLLIVFQKSMPLVSKKNKTQPVLFFIGTISMQLFLSHGYLKHPLLTYARNSDSELLILGYCLIFILVSITLSYVLWKLEKYFRTQFSKLRVAEK